MFIYKKQHIDLISVQPHNNSYYGSEYIGLNKVIIVSYIWIKTQGHLKLLKQII